MEYTTRKETISRLTIADESFFQCLKLSAFAVQTLVTRKLLDIGKLDLHRMSFQKSGARTDSEQVLKNMRAKQERLTL